MIVLYIILTYLVVGEIIAMIIRSRKKWGTHPFKSSGCNIFNNENRYPFCVEHDKRYREGGWVIARLKADLQLFASLFLYDSIIMAVIMFLGVRMFSMWAFQYGKKRELWYE